MFANTNYLIIFVSVNHDNSINKKHKQMKITTLTPDQAGTILDLVNDQIRSQRQYLNKGYLNRVHIADLTHLRNLKKVLLNEERAQMRAEAAEMQEAENIQLFEMFHR